MPHLYRCWKAALQFVHRQSLHTKVRYRLDLLDRRAEMIFSRSRCNRFSYCAPSSGNSFIGCFKRTQDASNPLQTQAIGRFVAYLGAASYHVLRFDHRGCHAEVEPRFSNLLLSVRCSFFNQGCNLLRPGDINRVTGTLDFDHVALGSFGVPAFEVRIDDSVSCRY